MELLYGDDASLSWNVTIISAAGKGAILFLAVFQLFLESLSTKKAWYEGIVSMKQSF